MIDWHLAGLGEGTLTKINEDRGFHEDDFVSEVITQSFPVRVLPVNPETVHITISTNKMVEADANLEE